MIDLEFLSLVITNFKMFTHERVTLYLGGSGLVFVGGDNKVEPRLGANDVGKTSLFEALTWCLFGRTVDNLRNPDIKPWAGTKGSPLVFASLKINGVEHAISRTASPNKLSMDGEETGQDEIDRLLGFNFDIFIRTILLGQGQPLFIELQPREQMELFSTVLELDRWEERSERASKETKALELDLSTASGELIGAEGAQAQIESLIKTAKLSAAAWESERSKRTEGQKTEIADLKKKLKTAQDRRDDADLAYDGAMTELNALRKEGATNEAELLAASEARNEAKLVLDDLRRQGCECEAELDALGEADECPICHQPIRGTQLAKHKQEVKAKIVALAKRANAQKKTHSAAEARREAIGKKIHDSARHRESFVNKAETARADLDLAADAVVKFTTQISGLQASHKTQEDEINPHREQLQTLRKKLSQTTTQLEDLDKEIAALKRSIERTKFWIQGFKEVRLYILEEVLQELELATNALLPESGLVDWQVNYAVERETNKGTIQRGLRVTVLSPANAGPVKWESWGGGVGQRLRVVSTLALSEVLLERAGVRPNLEILDEPTKYVSVEGVQDLCEFLALRAKQLSKAIFYVDHLAVESRHFTDVVTVVKSDKGSYIEG